MKNLLSLLFLFFSFSGFSQQNSTIDFTLGIDYTYRTVDADASFNEILEIRDQETGKLNWRAGFNYSTRLSKSLLIKTGLRFASIGYKLNRSDLQFGSQNNGNGGFDPDVEGLSFNYNYYFLETPLMLRLESKEVKKISPFVEAGFSGMFYLTTQIIRVESGDKSISYEKEILPELNKFQLALNLSVGLNITPNENIQFFAQPIFRYHLTEMSGYPIEEHLWSAGLEIGLRKKLD